MRLVDVDVAIKEVKEMFSMGDCHCDEYAIVGMLNSLPSRQLPETSQIDEAIMFAKKTLENADPENMYNYDEFCRQILSQIGFLTLLKLR